MSGTGTSNTTTGTIGHGHTDENMTGTGSGVEVVDASVDWVGRWSEGLNRFVARNTNAGMSREILEILYKAVCGTVLEDLPPSGIRTMDLRRFLLDVVPCLNNSEFAELVAFGSIIKIAQVYWSLDRKRETYAPVFGQLLGDATVSMSLLVSMLSGTHDEGPIRADDQQIRMYLDVSMNTDWITFALERTGMSVNAEMVSQMSEARSQTVPKSGVAAKTYNSGMPW